MKEYRRSTGEYNADLRAQIKSGKIPFLSEFSGNNADYAAWSSSILPAIGTAPKILSFEKDELRESQMAYDAWTCMYSAYSAMDGDPATTWSEGVPGDGLGEILVVKLDLEKKIEIWGGYGKNERTYKLNNRPQKIRVYLMKTEALPAFNQWNTEYTNIALLTNVIVTLQDINDFQDLPLPKVKSKVYNAEWDSEAVTTFIAIEILSIYRGGRYDDTCICEVRSR